MSGELTVSKLAHELGLPASTVLEECHRLGIDAAWAGGVLTSQQANVLRDRLAPIEGGDGSLRRPSTPPGAALPQRRPNWLPAAGHAGPVVPGGPGSGPLRYAEDAGRGATELPNRPPAGRVRRFDRTARTAAIAGIVGAVLLLLAPASPHVVLTVAVWLGAVVAGLVALVAGNRARYRISTHPDRYRGMPVAVAAMVAGLLVVVSLGLGVWAVVRTAPASQGPSAITARSDVAELRWAYQRVRRIADNGWTRPAKDVGSCWALPADDEEPREEERVERTYRNTSCRTDHDAEVLAVFAIRPEADVAYPGAGALVVDGLERCEPVVDALPGRGTGLSIVIEYPTEAGWDDADHDVACVAMVDRRGSLTDTPVGDPVAEKGD